MLQVQAKTAESLTYRATTASSSEVVLTQFLRSATRCEMGILATLLPQLSNFKEMLATHMYILNIPESRAAFSIKAHAQHLQH